MLGAFALWAVRTICSRGGIGGPITTRLCPPRGHENGDDRGWIDMMNLGQHVPRINNVAGRLTFVFDPNEDLDATLKSR